MVDIWELGGLLVFSAIKFFLAPSAAVILGYGFWLSALISFLGGSIGFFLFFNFGKLMGSLLSKFGKGKKKKTFTRKNKLIVKAKLNYGLLGLAFLTPCLFGLPLGAILASNYYSKSKRVWPVFFGSILIWSFLLTYVSVYIKLI